MRREAKLDAEYKLSFIIILTIYRYHGNDVNCWKVNFSPPVIFSAYFIRKDLFFIVFRWRYQILWKKKTFIL